MSCGIVFSLASTTIAHLSAGLVLDGFWTPKSIKNESKIDIEIYLEYELVFLLIFVRFWDVFSFIFGPKIDVSIDT